MYVIVSPHDGLPRLFPAKSLWANNIRANRLNDDAMEKTSTMKQARSSVLVALALICAVSCAKIDDGSSAVAPEQPVQPTVLLPTRSYEEALSLARKSIALGRPGPNPLGHCPFDPQRTRPMRHYPVYTQRRRDRHADVCFQFRG